MPYQRILIALDGSKLSERALQHVVRLAEPGAYIHIISVSAEDPTSEAASMVSAIGKSTPETAAQWPSIQPPADPRQAEARQNYLHNVADWLSHADYDVTTEVKTGDVISAIVETAKAGYEILIMSTHGRSGAAKIVLGSVTEAVLKDAPCPVFVIPASKEHL